MASEMAAHAAAAAAAGLFDEDDHCEGMSEETDGNDSGLGGVLQRPPLSKSLFLLDVEERLPDALDMLRTGLDDGHGEFIYKLGGDGSDGEAEDGFKDDELPDAQRNFLAAVGHCGAVATELGRKSVGASGCVTVEYLIRREAEEDDFMEIRVAVVGNVDAGKSTMLGVLTHDELDNGRGLARQRLFRHKHEMESGRTSSVGNDILGFDSKGAVVNRRQIHGSGVNWEQICRKSSKVITFIDLAGHERYLKTTVFGMTGHAPDFCMLMVGANAGVIGMAKEHLGLALALNVPVFVVVTKIDMCPPEVRQDTLKLLNRILKSPGCRKIPLMVHNSEDVVLAATNFVSQRMCPVFQLSNVTGENLDLLKMFLNLLSSQMNYKLVAPAEFQVDDTYSVPGVGTVIAGTALCGSIRANETLLLGPDPLGNFVPCTVKSIQRKRMPVMHVRAGQTATFALKKVRRNQVRKGMVMVSRAAQPAACWEFQGEILVLHHPTTISARYQAMVHCGSVRQTASILEMSSENLRTGDKALCLFRFIKSPEYLREGARLVFREGRTKAVGHVLKVFPHIPNSAIPRGVPSRSRVRREEAAAAAAVAALSTAAGAMTMSTAATDQQPAATDGSKEQATDGADAGLAADASGAAPPLGDAAASGAAPPGRSGRRKRGARHKH